MDGRSALNQRCSLGGDCIVLDESTIEIEGKLFRSMMGKESNILSANGLLPKGERLVVGENTRSYL